MSDALKPCPFCLGEAVLENVLRPGARDGDAEARQYFVRCRSCAAEGPWAKHPGNAARSWDRRAEEENLRAELADAQVKQHAATARVVELGTELDIARTGLDRAEQELCRFYDARGNYLIYRTPEEAEAARRVAALELEQLRGEKGQLLARLNDLTTKNAELGAGTLDAYTERDTYRAIASILLAAAVEAGFDLARFAGWIGPKLEGPYPVPPELDRAVERAAQDHVAWIDRQDAATPEPAAEAR